MRALRVFVLSLLAFVVALPATAESTLRVRRVFSTQDATFQFVQFDVVDVGPRTPLEGSVTVYDAAGAWFNAFPLVVDDLPPTRATYVVALDRNGRFDYDDPYGEHSPDGILTSDGPLLPPGGGTIRVTGQAKSGPPNATSVTIDEFAFGPLPDDGRTMLDRESGVVPAEFRGRFGVTERIDIPFATAIEFFHAGMESYLWTSRAEEIAALDGRLIAGWTRTSGSRSVLVRPNRKDPDRAQSATTVPLCRLMLRGVAGISHVFTAWASECQALAASGAALESAAVAHVLLPDATTGACPRLVVDIDGFGQGGAAGPIYRLWNGRVDEPRHRLVRTKAQRDALTAQGWTPEGYGPDAVAFCE